MVECHHTCVSIHVCSRKREGDSQRRERERETHLRVAGKVLQQDTLPFVVVLDIDPDVHFAGLLRLQPKLGGRSLVKVHCLGRHGVLVPVVVVVVALSLPLSLSFAIRCFVVIPCLQFLWRVRV